MFYICPVCGNNELPNPPRDWEICPCCSTMFGYSDVNWGEDELRCEWIASGARWVDEGVKKPECWSPINQLRNIGYELTDADMLALAKVNDNAQVVVVNLQNFRMQQKFARVIDNQQNDIVEIPFPHRTIIEIRNCTSGVFQYA